MKRLINREVFGKVANGEELVSINIFVDNSDVRSVAFRNPFTVDPFTTNEEHRNIIVCIIERHVLVDVADCCNRCCMGLTPKKQLFQG